MSLSKVVREEIKSFVRTYDWVEGAKKISRQVALETEETIKSVAGWEKSIPIALGSWARGELCPLSDADILFLGPESDVTPVVSRLQESQVKLRARVPLDPADWTKGIDFKGILALKDLKPLTAQGADLCQKYSERISQNMFRIRSQIRVEILKERKIRLKRYDSSPCLLEPNIKYGAGGLRDYLQLVQLSSLYPEKISDEIRTLLFDLKQSKWELVFLRQYCHYVNAGETLAAHSQVDLARPGLTLREVMRRVHKNLSRIAFFTDLVSNLSTKSKKQWSMLEDPNLLTSDEILWHFREQSSLLFSFRVRLQGKTVRHPPSPKVWRSSFDPSSSPKFFECLFASKILSSWIPELAPLEGLVQHDQYHRYSAGHHVERAMLRVVETKNHPSKLGLLRPLVRDWTLTDWRVLLYTALFHDIAKGTADSDGENDQETSHDHSEKGAFVCERELKAWGEGPAIVAEVSWMVANHLLFSETAFRRNPSDKETIRNLLERGVTKERATRLAIFTAIDIWATNPEALTNWKVQLLRQVAHSMRSEQAYVMGDWDKWIHKVNLFGLKDKVYGLDSQLLMLAPKAALRGDLQALSREGIEEAAKDSPLVARDKRGQVWVRFLSRDDRQGLFLSWCEQLFELGLTVEFAAVTNLCGVGPYDWFKLKTSRPIKRIKRDLARGQLSTQVRAEVKFSQIEVIERSSDSGVIIFRGQDQKGALMEAARTLYQCGLTIEWAQVGTWGKQIEDVFGVRSLGRPLSEVARDLLIRSDSL